MANLNNPFGFSPYGVLRGMGTPNFGFDPRRILSTNTTPIFRGDPVATGTSTEAGFIIQRVAGSTQAAGIFWDCEYYSIAGKIPVMRPWWPASGDALANPFPANIISNPNATFLVQTGNSATTPSPATQANIGNTCDVAYTGASNAGNTTTGISSCYLDLSTAVASSGTTLPFRILQLASDFLQLGAPGADPTTAYNWVLVGFNWQELRSTTAVA